jgi:superfamily II DNA/RNA helicase
VCWDDEQLAKRPDIPSDLTFGPYATSNRSGFWLGGRFQHCDRTLFKDRVRKGEIKMLLGTDAASKGLILQRLGTPISIDLPWNPTRLEQRKGRIQRIGQARN